MKTLTIDNTNMLSILGSDDPIEIDLGLRETIRGVGLSILTIGLGLAKIKSEQLFLELNFRNITSYIEDLAKSTKNDRGNVFNWLKIGETYLKYREELEKISFTGSDGPSKLPYLERALTRGEKKEVFDNLMNMTLRKFKAYAKSCDEKSVEDAASWEIRGNILYIKGQRAIIINRNLGKKTINMLKGAVRIACRALERKSTVVAVHLRTNREANIFKARARRVRERIQNANDRRAGT